MEREAHKVRFWDNLIPLRGGIDSLLASQGDEYMFSESTNEELLATIETADNYYRNGDTRLFNLIDKNAKVFVVNATEPFLGRDAFREHFEPNFAGQRVNGTFCSETYRC